MSFDPDFGASLRYRAPALPLVLQRLPATVELAVVSLAFAVAITVIALRMRREAKAARPPVASESAAR